MPREKSSKEPAKEVTKVAGIGGKIKIDDVVFKVNEITTAKNVSVVFG